LMNKKVMALAVAGVLAAPAALAQTSNVPMAAPRWVSTITARARDQTARASVLPQPAALAEAMSDWASRRIFDNSSRVGLRGTEDLGNNEGDLPDRDWRQHRQRQHTGQGG
jgi:predicted porin